jgi:hypothetical protein
MSTETIVNRTPETFGQKLEREQLEESIQAEKAAELERMNSEGPAPETAPEVLTPASLEDQVREILGVPAPAPVSPEFAQFKKEVIAAFKHIGLDTAKHFS